MRTFVQPITKHTEHITPGHWTVQRWFRTVIFLLLAWVALYMVLHSPFVKPGYQYTGFSSEQLLQINRLLTAKATRPATHTEELPPIYDSATGTIIKQVQVMVAPAICDSCNVTKALLYINSEFAGNITGEQIAQLRDYMYAFTPDELSILLPRVKLRTNAFFWFTGTAAYLEIILWVLIGVISSFLAAIPSVARTAYKNTLHDYEVLYHLARLFYTPFSVIILILGYNYLKHTDNVEINITEGAIVFSFLCGFLSGSITAVFQRFREAMIPPMQMQAPMPLIAPHTPQQQLPPSPPPLVQPTPQARPNITTQHYDTIPAATKMQQPPVQEDNGSVLQRTVKVVTPTNGNGHAKNDSEIEEVQVELNLDDSSLFDEERSEILEAAFSNAMVTLHSINDGNILALSPTRDPALHVIRKLRPGIYILRATLTQSMADGRVMPLFGERTVYITHEYNRIELYIKKYEAGS